MRDRSPGVLIKEEGKYLIGPRWIHMSAYWNISCYCSFVNNSGCEKLNLSIFQNIWNNSFLLGIIRGEWITTTYERVSFSIKHIFFSKFKWHPHTGHSFLVSFTHETNINNTYRKDPISINFQVLKYNTKTENDS